MNITGSNPCLTCRRVHHPEECERKQCKYWAEWFKWHWDQAVNRIREHYGLPEPVPDNLNRLREIVGTLENRIPAGRTDQEDV